MAMKKQHEYKVGEKIIVVTTTSGVSRPQYQVSEVERLTKTQVIVKNWVQKFSTYDGWEIGAYNYASTRRCLRPYTEAFAAEAKRQRHERAALLVLESIKDSPKAFPVEFSEKVLRLHEDFKALKDIPTPSES